MHILDRLKAPGLDLHHLSETKGTGHSKHQGFSVISVEKVITLQDSADILNKYNATIVVFTDINPNVV